MKDWLKLGLQRMLHVIDWQHCFEIASFQVKLFAQPGNLGLKVTKEVSICSNPHTAEAFELKTIVIIDLQEIPNTLESQSID